jgi:hypothetical protein
MQVARLLAAGVWLAAALFAQDDPFAGVTEKANTTTESQGWFKKDLGFRKEIMSEFTTDADGSPASRQSLGFEVLKKFSTATSTVASFDFQGRLVRRDGFNPVQNDMMGAMNPGWSFEYHNLYADIYNVVGIGKVNFRAGHFYVPFGLNLQTDTHGTVLQLSNESNFGFERDWYAGVWGSINRHLNYDAYYMAGSGYDLKFKGQSGLGAVRVSLSNRFSSDHGLEGGVSVIAGERLDEMNRPLKTSRVGVDGRYRRAARGGSLAFTTELSGGRDARERVLADLNQVEYLRASRRWGVAGQYRHIHGEATVAGEFTWYFRNDVAGSNEHWLKLNVAQGSTRTVVTLQYYFYR